MAKYYNYLIRNGIPLKAVKVRLMTLEGSLVDTTVTDEQGYYSFSSVLMGSYNIQFFGNDLDRSDWLYNVPIIDPDDLVVSGIQGPPGIDGENAFVALISSNNGAVFRNNTTPSSIDLTATLYNGGIEQVTGVTYSWEKNDISLGLTTKTINVVPADVTGSAKYTCDITFASKTFTGEITLIDVFDGVDGSGASSFYSTLTTSSGVIFSTATNVYGTVVTCDMYEGGTLLTSDVDYSWKIDNTLFSPDPGNIKSIIVDTEDVLGTSKVECFSTYSGITRIASETFVDFTDPFTIFDVDPVVGHLAFGNEPKIVVKEDTDHFGFSPIGHGTMTVSGLNIKKGVVKYITLSYRPAEATSWAHNSEGSNTWKQIATYFVNMVSGSTYNQNFNFSGLPLNIVAGGVVNYDFKATFHNANGEQATIEYLTVDSGLAHGWALLYTDVNDKWFGFDETNLVGQKARIGIYNGNTLVNDTTYAWVDENAGIQYWLGPGSEPPAWTHFAYHDGLNNALYSKNKTFIGQEFFRYTVPELALSDDGGKTWYTQSPGVKNITALKSNNVKIRFKELSSAGSLYTYSSPQSGDYIEDWDGNDITITLNYSSHFSHIRRYAILGLFYGDTGNSTIHGNLTTDGPGGAQSFSIQNAEWRVLKIMELGAQRMTNIPLLTTVDLQLPPGRLCSIYVYMLVDTAPVDEYQGLVSRNKIKIGINDEELLT